MTREENEMLTKTGPGTPCGELLRRYWQPAALSEELAEGGAPLPVRLLGEDLVLFRDDGGRPGLLGLHCSHRGADLSYGRVEDGGLRCIYHGWLYDIHGRCLDQPGEPGGGERKDSIRHPAYPCIERSGAIFAYLGPGEPPLLPIFEFLTASDDHVFVKKFYHECNYLQGNEGNIDLIHLSFLHHNRYRDAGGPPVPFVFSGRGASPGLESMEAEIAEFGVRICKIRKLEPDSQHLYLCTFLFPNAFAFPGPFNKNNGYGVNWHVPIDDTHHWLYDFSFSRDQTIDRKQWKERAGLIPGYRLTRNKSNRYLQDRASMEKESFTGIEFSDFNAHDLCAVEGPGPIQDRTKEHLASTDATIVVSRKLILNAIREVREGREPPYLVKDARQNRFPNILTYTGMIPKSKNWKEYFREPEVAGGCVWPR